MWLIYGFGIPAPFIGRNSADVNPYFLKGCAATGNVSLLFCNPHQREVPAAKGL
jgi:hypothetical protein